MEFRSDFEGHRAFSFNPQNPIKPIEQTKVALAIQETLSSLGTGDERASLSGRASSEKPLLERQASVSSTSSRIASSVQSLFSFYKLGFRCKAEEVSLISDLGNKTILQGQHIAKGKAKHVWKIIGEEGFVYYTAVKGVINSGMNSKEREIREEVKIAKNIQANLLHETFPSIKKEEAKEIINAYGTVENWLNEIEKGETHDLRILDQSNASKLQELREALSNLAVNLEEVDVSFENSSESQTILREYTVKTDAARGDLSDEFTKDYSLDKARSFGKGVLNGLLALHRAGFLHRDIKPENFLCMDDAKGNLTVKLSDFGKTKRFSPGEEIIHLGNQTYIAPEGKDSPKSEVYSAGLVLIRIFEEVIFKEGKEKLEIDSPYLNRSIAVEGKKGVEKFLIQNTKIFQKQLSKLGRIVTGIKEYLNPYARTAEDLKNAEKEIHKYIDSLAFALKEQTQMKDEKINQLAVFLKDMTKSIPDERISIEEALYRYQKIFP